jgi:uncharacterized protein (DUF433 family)
VTPAEERELFQSVAKACSGKPMAQSMSVMVNMLANMLRQQHTTRHSAEEGVDQLAANLKTLLANHYDERGSRRSVLTHKPIDLAHLASSVAH